MIACLDWTFKGVSNSYPKNVYDLSLGSSMLLARRCKEEPKTRQWLGTESEIITNSEDWAEWKPVPNDF